MAPRKVRFGAPLARAMLANNSYRTYMPLSETKRSVWVGASKKVEVAVENSAVRILDAHRIMAAATVRPDGWPQVTIVGYANVDLLIYFMISRSSQKFANIQRDNRIAIAVGEEPRELSTLQALYSSAYALEVTDTNEREQAWRLLRERHPNLEHYALEDQSESVLMRALCEHVSVLDNTQGWNATEQFIASSPGEAQVEGEG
jgi:nitroimidazol reductase NimA-like FMN-containing flavoprotein (pyridoxamine 5'-phosphate oxidase superfamily)